MPQLVRRALAKQAQTYPPWGGGNIIGNLGQ